MKYFAALVLLLSLAAMSVHGTSETEAKKAPGGGGPKPPTPTIKPGGGKGDPILTDFSGRTFEFFGKVGSTYSVISEKTHQLSMKLKEGKMWDHNGSYMSTIGLKYQDHSVVVENVDDSLLVTLDGELLTLRKDQTEAEHILGLAQGELQLLWQLHRAEHGNTVEINTELLNVIIWVTPAGTRDEGGKVQPAYLNFDVKLLSAPAHNAMEGIVGQSYAKVMAGQAEADDFTFHGVESQHEMATLFDAAHPKCLFGKASSMVRARKLIESHAAVSFPLLASFA